MSRNSLAKSDIRIIFMGTKGGPSIVSTRCLPQSTALIVNEQLFLIDTGYGTSWRMLENQLPLKNIHKIFITHLHNDHVQDYPAVIMNGWSSGLKQPIAVYGPKGTQMMTEGVWQTFSRDIGLRIHDEGKPDPRNLVQVTEMSEGVIYQDQEMTVSALVVPHPPFPQGEAFAFRFDIGDIRLVFSGDTAFFPPLAEFSLGADVLVHEAVHVAGVEQLAASIGNGSHLAEAIISHHTPVEQVGLIAQQAQAKLLVLNHLVPVSTPHHIWRQAIAESYDGPLMIAEDNLCVVLDAEPLSAIACKSQQASSMNHSTKAV